MGLKCISCNKTFRNWKHTCTFFPVKIIKTVFPIILNISRSLWLGKTKRKYFSHSCLAELLITNDGRKKIQFVIIDFQKKKKKIERIDYVLFFDKERKKKMLSAFIFLRFVSMKSIFFLESWNYPCLAIPFYLSAFLFLHLLFTNFQIKTAKGWEFFSVIKLGSFPSFLL